MLLFIKHKCIRIERNTKCKFWFKISGDGLIQEEQSSQEPINTNLKQEMFKKERGVITQEQVKLLNEVYLLVKPISDDAAQLAKYSLPKPKSSQNSVNNFIESKLIQNTPLSLYTLRGVFLLSI